MKKASWKKWLPRLLAHTFPDTFESGTFLRIQNFHVYTYPYSNRIGPSTRIQHVSGCTLVRPQDSSGNIGKRAYVEKRAKFASCSALCHDSRFYRSNYDRIRTEIKKKCEEQGSFTRNDGCHLK